MVTSLVTPPTGREEMVPVFARIYSELDGPNWRILDEVTLAHGRTKLEWRIRAFLPAVDTELP